MWGFLIALAIVLTIVVVAFFALRRFICKIPIVGGILCGGGGVPQGGACSLDTDCDGWSIFGSVACCGKVCAAKEQPTQTCADYCAKNPKVCTVGVPQGGACQLDPDCSGWQVFGSVACCGNVCVTKAQPAQTCVDYCKNNPKVCTVGTPPGDVCRTDADCSGWAAGGAVACCGATCVTKGSPTQTCKDYCAGARSSCRDGDGCMLDWDCPNWSVTGSVACCGAVRLEGQRLADLPRVLRRPPRRLLSPPTPRGARRRSGTAGLGRSRPSPLRAGPFFSAPGRPSCTPRPPRPGRPGTPGTPARSTPA